MSNYRIDEDSLKSLLKKAFESGSFGDSDFAGTYAENILTGICQQWKEHHFLNDAIDVHWGNPPEFNVSCDDIQVAYDSGHVEFGDNVTIVESGGTAPPIIVTTNTWDQEWGE